MISIRKTIEQLILTIKPVDTLETEHINFVKDWIGSGAPLFRTQKPATPDTHLVSYFLLVDCKTNQLLLVDHKKSGLWPGCFDEKDLTSFSR